MITVIGLETVLCLNELGYRDYSKPIKIGVKCCSVAPTFFTVIDSYPIELIFPIRQGRSSQQVGKKGRDKGRWSVGIKFCWLLNDFSRVVAWDWDTMNVNDKRFNPLVKPFIGKTIVLADFGFRDKDGVPENMKICKKGTWNERMCVETALSLVTVICDLKRIRHRLAVYIQARLAFVAACSMCSWTCSTRFIPMPILTR